jgi:hypothetical protein
MRTNISEFIVQLNIYIQLLQIVLHYLSQITRRFLFWAETRAGFSALGQVTSVGH